MSKSLAEKFNIATENEFSFLKLNLIDVDVRNKSITVNFIYPQSRADVLQDKQRIEDAIIRILNSNAKVTVKLTVSHFDKDFFLDKFISFLSKYPSVSATLKKADVIIEAVNNAFKVTLKLLGYVYDYCVEKKVENEIKEFLFLNYCDEIEPFLVKKEDAKDIALSDILPREESKLVLDDAEGRYIQAQNVDELIGPIIYDKATYIEDAVTPKDKLVVCGTLVQFDEYTRKQSVGDTEIKKFYRMTIEDYTGRIECLYFPSKYTKDKITLLKTGKTIVTRGSLEADKRNEGALVYIVKDISYCTLPQDFTLNRIRRKVEENYLTVFPQSFTATQQASLFETVKETIIPPFLKSKSFCVFDLETTGLNPRQDKIIELACVKIVDGEIKETFSSFVDPCIPIPQRITDLTGITDKDVFNKPKIDDVLIDFYKFIDGSAIVAQNLQFDFSFISFLGKPLNIYFDNEKYDTLILARKFFPGLKKYKLDFLAEYFGVKLDNAHRAIADAIATAEIFLKLAEKMQ